MQKQEVSNKNKLENAKALLDVLEDEVIAEKIGLELEIVQELRKNMELKK